jgi:hypothetical protein
MTAGVRAGSSPSSSRGRRMATRRVGSILLLLQGPWQPTDQEWDECLDILRPFVSIAKALVVTAGGGPTPAQRERLSAVIGKCPLRAAVVTDSIKVHFIVSTVALFIRRIRSFGSAKLGDAFLHLDLTSAEMALVLRNLAEMRAEAVAWTST